MADNKSYGRQLRTIGQSLEAQRIRIFELHQQGERFVVKGEPDQETSLLAKLINWQKRNRSAGLSSSLAFTPQDIDQLDRQGHAQRSMTNRLPDSHSLANILRTVGAHLESKGAELIELQKKELSITMLSCNQAGHPELEERTTSSLHDLFLRQHDKRKKVDR